MSDIVDRLLELPPKKLKIWSDKRKGRHRYKRRDRPERTKEQLAEYLRKQGFKTRKELRNGRGEGDPTDDDYWKAYGSWTAATKEIWGVQPLDRKYVIKSIIEFNLWSYDKYRKARLKRPDVLPSIYAVEKEFGSWAILKEMASAMSLRKTLQAYMELKRRLGKTPTRKDCQIAGIILDAALKIHKSKKNFDRFVESMEDMS